MGGSSNIEFVLKVIGAIGVIAALLLNWRSHAERATFDMIDRLYGLCHTLESHALRDWYLSHLFCISQQEYRTVKSQILGEMEKNPDRATEYLVKEKLFAIHVFIIYEQVFYQWKHTSGFFHRKRKRFLKEILSYFTDRLIVNPRLLHFVRTDPTGASLHLEPCSKKFLDEATNSTNANVQLDAAGPFAPLAGKVRVSP